MWVVLIIAIAASLANMDRPNFPKRCIKVRTIDKKLTCTSNRCLYSTKEDREYYLLRSDKLTKGIKFCIDGYPKHKKGEHERYLR